MDSLFINTSDAAYFLWTLLFSWQILLPTTIIIWLIIKSEKKRQIGRGIHKMPKTFS